MEPAFNRTMRCSKHACRAIRRERKSQKITLPALARSAGISRGLLSGIENNRPNISLDTLEKIAKALGVKARSLLP